MISCPSTRLIEIGLDLAEPARGHCRVPELVDHPRRDDVGGFDLVDRAGTGHVEQIDHVVLGEGVVATLDRSNAGIVATGRRQHDEGHEGREETGAGSNELHES